MLLERVGICVFFFLTDVSAKNIHNHFHSFHVRMSSTSSLHAHPGLTRFERIFATAAQVRSVECLHLRSVGGLTSNSTHVTLAITAYGQDIQRALHISCPRGGAHLSVAQCWRQDAASVLVHTENEQHDVANAFVVAAKKTDWTSGNFTVVADQLRLQSSTSPLDVHSFATHKYGLTLRCPKGGMALSSGKGGILAATDGNIDFCLQKDNSHLHLASRGHMKHTIHLGNAVSETIIENQLTVKGKLVLAEDTVVEKRVSVVHELQNVVELGGLRTTGSTTNAIHPDSTGYDFGVVSPQPSTEPHTTENHRQCKAGMVYDHRRKLFYFGTELGEYQHHRFALPRAYADVQARSLFAQQKIYAPFVESHALQCRSIRSGGKNTLTLQAPRVQCTQMLQSASVQSELITSVRQQSQTSTTQELDAENVTAKTIRVDTLCIGDHLRLERLHWNTVGPNSTHPTLQAFFDAVDDRRTAASSSSETTSSEISYESEHIVLEATSVPHNGNSMVNQHRCLIDGRHSVLTGVLEVTEECESFTLTDTRAAQLTLTSSSDYKRDTSPSCVYTIRNVHGTVKDWCFHLPGCTLRIEHCTLAFTNQVLGELKAVDVRQSIITGAPWRSLQLAATKNT